MDSASNSSGFSNHVFGQLHEMSQQATTRGRGNRGRGRGQARPAWSQAQQTHLPQNPRQQQPPFAAAPDSFPPLGALPPPRNFVAQPQVPQYQPEPQAAAFDHARHGTPREYQERARGNFRGGRHFNSQQHRPQQFPQQPSQSPHMAQYHTNGRPAARHGQLYNPNAGMNHGTAEQQRSMRHLIMKQSDYLTGIGRLASDEHKFTAEEKDIKESFRLSLEELSRSALGAKYPDLQLEQVKLKCYGSLANGFALKDCDMDLLLSLPKYEEPESTEASTVVSPEGEDTQALDDGQEERGFKADVRRILEKAYLDHEYGARLLTQTRIPILRICQTPTPELLHNLMENRAEWERSIDHTGAAETGTPLSIDPPAEVEVDAVEQALTDFTITKIARGKRGVRGNAGLEFTADCGIQCDLNFSNFVALHNSTLLRLYNSFDPRVNEIGIFVKIWAKTRDINTPYRGTLSSYGWVLMVLHYLMNVANPPVIPNLQYSAKIEDSWNPNREIELFEGFDVRFVQDHRGLHEIHQDMAANRNRESAGQLLRGFFLYYATRNGFHWTRDIISIRTKGGLLSKQGKGWTEAKWQQSQNKSVRNRYLLAIEDPFEIEHNIARTVGHHGIVTIRNEFRRAWAIIEKIGTDEEVPAHEFLLPVTDHVDTLSKDQESYRQRQMQLRKEMEAKEQAMLQQGDEHKTDHQTDGMLGTSEEGKPRAHFSAESHRESSESKLTSTPPAQEQKHMKPSGSWRRRKLMDSNDDVEDSNGEASEKEEQDNVATSSEIRAEPRNRTEGPTSRAEVLLASGYDRDGNPIPWDIETQEGRWLHWRDTKVRHGTLGGFHNESLRELNEECPYDSRRPNPYIGKPYRNRFQMMAMDRPPWPANNPNKGDSTGSPSARTQPVEAPDASESNNDVESRAPSQVVPQRDLNTQSSGDHVGEIIPWDMDSQAGRWLRSRDLRMRLGSWVNPGRLGKSSTGWYAQLNDAFPYNPQMTWTELEVKNRLLRQHYKSTPFPVGIQGHRIRDAVAGAPAPAPRIYERAPSSLARRRVARESHESASQDVLAWEADDASQHTSSFVDSSPSQIGKSSDAIGWSDDHPSHDTVSDRAPTTPPDSDRIPDVGFLRNQRLAFFMKSRTSSKSEVDTNVDFYSRAAEHDPPKVVDEEFQTPLPSCRNAAPLRAHEVSVPESSFRDTEADVQGGEENYQFCGIENDLHEHEAEFSDSPIMEDVSLRVPATLYPDVDNTKRPRDEDPRVMPIPRSFGFQFDPRQLQDLAVISKGGNGCAREGAQFNIEHEEYEWGGGGMMGYKTSTGPQLAGISGGHTPYEAGRGDEEGLLDELPRDLD